MANKKVTDVKAKQPMKANKSNPESGWNRDFEHFFANAKMPEHSLYDTLSPEMERVKKVVKDSNIVKVKDAYDNPVTGAGESDIQSNFASYGFDNSTWNMPLWMSLYNSSWVFKRAIDKPSEDEINCGITLHGDKDFTQYYLYYKRYQTSLIDLVKWGALFGGSIGVMLFDGISDEELALPINPTKIKGKQMRMYCVDRWFGVAPSTETVKNMKDIDFGKPMYYDVTFADGHHAKVHHSYVLRYEHRNAPQLIKTGLLQGWGYAEGSHILNELARDDQLKASITTLINKSLIEIIKMDGMKGVFMGSADAGAREQLTKRLEMVNWARSYNSLTFLDTNDQYEQYQLTSVSGLAEIMEKNMSLIAAALEMQGILYGDLKGGLNQESDALNRYALTIENRCNALVRPVIHKFLIIASYVLGEPNTVIDFDFNSLAADNLATAKMTSIKTFAEALDSLTKNGYISKYQAAKSMALMASQGTVDLTISPEWLQKLKFEENMEVVKTFNSASKVDNMKQNQFPEGTELGAIPGGKDGASAMMSEEVPPESIQNIEKEVGETENNNGEGANEETEDLG